MDELDGPVLSALQGPHRGFASLHGSAARYDPAVTPFAALLDTEDPGAWRDLAELSGGATLALFATEPARLPSGWTLERHLRCLQMIATERTPSGRPGGAAIVDLGADEVPDMLDLVERTHPGPFLPRTVELGGYVGVREPDGRLVAMAGRRMATGSWREVSAVCTDPAFQGRGYGRSLIEAVVAGVRAEGERAFLHVTVDNPAIGLYRSLGFEPRREIGIAVVRATAAGAGPVRPATSGLARTLPGSPASGQGGPARSPE